MALEIAHAVRYPLSLFSKGVWVERSDWWLGRSRRAGRRRVSLACPNVRCRLSSKNGGSAQSRCQPRATLAFALVIRSSAVSVGALAPYLNEIVGLAIGGVASAFYGACFFSAIKNEQLTKTIAALLAALGVLILFEVAHPFQYAQAISAGAALHFGAGFALGIVIGLVSSILGVAGGELLVPTMMFIFGADIKTAGTASIVISVCVVTSGLWRYWRSGAMETRLGARRIVSAMSAGSLIGAALGGLAVGFAPVAALKVILGSVLIAAATKVALSKR